MECSKCGKEIGQVDEKGNVEAAYLVQMGRAGTIHEEGVEEPYEDFFPDEDVGYFCSECLSKGV